MKRVMSATLRPSCLPLLVLTAVQHLHLLALTFQGCQPKIPSKERQEEQSSGICLCRSESVDFHLT